MKKPKLIKVSNGMNGRERLQCPNCNAWELASIMEWGGSSIIIELSNRCHFKCFNCRAEYKEKHGNSRSKNT